jgi:hypothetical protein
MNLLIINGFIFLGGVIVVIVLSLICIGYDLDKRHPEWDEFIHFKRRRNDNKRRTRKPTGDT